MKTTHDRRVLLTVLLSPEPTPALTADDEGSVFLRRLLVDRTRNVYRPLALPWPDNAEKLVHESRVGCRRLVEALRLAMPAIGRPRAQTAILRARDLRRALGGAREAHVMIADLRRLARRASLTDEATRGLDALRASGTEALAKASKTYPPEQLLADGIDVLTLAETPRRPLPLRQLAARHLFRRAEEVKSLLVCMEEPERVRDHHRLRVRFKSLRYTVEILAKPFSEEVDARRVILQAKAMQDALGVLNDAQDLLVWLGNKHVAAHLEPPVVEAMREVVQCEQEERFEVARDSVCKVGYNVATDLQRAAGKIGRI